MGDQEIKKAVELGEPLVLATPNLLIMTATTLNNMTLEGEKATRPIVVTHETR